MEVDTSIHPNPIPDSHHRKIELQSAHDLTYLQANLVTSARQKLDLHFPPSAAFQKSSSSQAQPATVISLDGIASNAQNEQRDESLASVALEKEDPLRAKVRELVDTFMTKTWQGACKNITVNGMDATTIPIMTSQSPSSSESQPKEPEAEIEGVDFVYEAYDSRLQAKVAGLYGELEALTAQVSQLRRTAPGQGAQEFQQRLTSELCDDDDGFEKQMAAVRDGARQDEDGTLKLKPLRDGWHDDVQEMYARGTGELVSLAGLRTDETLPGASSQRGSSLTEIVGKIQRARTVALELE